MQLIIQKKFLYLRSLLKNNIIKTLLIFILLSLFACRSDSKEYYLLKLKYDSHPCEFYYILHNHKLYDANYIFSYGYEDVDIFKNLDSTEQNNYSNSWHKINEALREKSKKDIIIKSKFHVFNILIYNIKGDFLKVHGDFSNSKYSRNIFMGNKYFVADQIFMPIVVKGIIPITDTIDVLDKAMLDENLNTKQNESILFNWCGIEE